MSAVPAAPPPLFFRTYGRATEADFRYGLTASAAESRPAVRAGRF